MELCWLLIKFAIAVVLYKRSRFLMGKRMRFLSCLCGVLVVLCLVVLLLCFVVVDSAPYYVLTLVPAFVQHAVHDGRRVVSSNSGFHQDMPTI